MDSKIEFEKNQPELMKIDAGTLKYPPHAVELIVDEALDLSVTCMEDEEKLTVAGLNRKFITEMASRALTLRYSEAIWKAKQGELGDAEDLWKKVGNADMNFKNELIHHFKFAYRKDALLMKKVLDIAEGNSFPDMVQDLIEMHVLGTENPKPLEAINFDLSLLDKAKKIADRDGELLALVNGERGDGSEEMDIKKRAFTFLDEAVKEVREYGKYVFWRDPERLKKYTSKLHRQYDKKKNADNEEENTEE